MGFAENELIVMVILVLGMITFFAFLPNLVSIVEDLRACKPPIKEYQFWCKDKANTDYYDVISRSSMTALACAVNSAGEQQIFSSLCPREQVVAGFGVFAQSDRTERCYGELDKSCVKCSVSAQGSYTKERNFAIQRTIDAENRIEEKCSGFCIQNGKRVPGCKPEVKKLPSGQIPASYDIFEERTNILFPYDWVRPAPKTGSVQKFSVVKTLCGKEDYLLAFFGASREDTIRLCQQDSFVAPSELVIKESTETEIDFPPPGIQLPGTSPNPLGRRGEVKKITELPLASCECTIHLWTEKQSTYKVYGQTSEEAKQTCALDDASDKPDLPADWIEGKKYISQEGKAGFYKCGNPQSVMQNGYFYRSQLASNLDPLPFEPLHAFTSPDTDFYSCTATIPLDPTVSCDVTNFKLPQDVNPGLPHYLGFFGLPRTLGWWQEFPRDEDTWSEDSDWTVYGIIGAVTLIGPLKGLKILGRVAKISPKGTVLSRLALPLSRGGRLAYETGKVLAENYFTLRGLTFSAIRIAFVTPFAASAAWEYETWKERRGRTTEEYLNPHPNKLVLLKALQPPAQEFDLSTALQGKPLLLQWTPGWFNNDEKNLHFSSPCNIKQMTVSQTIFGCQEYQMDNNLSIVSCITNHQGTYSSLPSGGVWCENPNPEESQQFLPQLGNRRYSKILKWIFDDVKKNDVPFFPTYTRQFYRGDYIIPIDLQDCTQQTREGVGLGQGAFCRRITYLFLTDESLPSPPRKVAERGIIERGDLVITLTEYEVEEGGKKVIKNSVEEQSRFAGRDFTDTDVYPVKRPVYWAADFKSTDGKYTLTILAEAEGNRRENEKFIGGRIALSSDIVTDPNPEFSKWKKSVWFAGRFIDGEIPIRELTISYVDIQVGKAVEDDGFIVRVSDSGNSDSETSTVIISELLPFSFIPGEGLLETNTGGLIQNSHFRLGFEDKDKDGRIDVRGAKASSTGETQAACYTKGVLVSNVVAGTESGGYDPNYCVREMNTAAKLGQVASWTLFVGSLFVGGVPGALVGVASAAGGIVAKRQQTWPRGGIG